jgi:RND family efflux transporter MFP subunit
MAESSPKSERPGKRVDLSRLRIQRGGSDKVRVRGFPWLRLLFLCFLAGAAFLTRDHWLGIVQGRIQGQLVRAARAERVGPGNQKAGDVASNGYVVASRSASLATVRSGRLVEFDLEVGDTVRENEIVARIQYDDIEAQIASLEVQEQLLAAREAEVQGRIEAALAEKDGLDADIASAQVAIEQAEEEADRLDREVDRNRKLHETKRIDAGTWDRVQTEARKGRRAVRAAEVVKSRREALLLPWRSGIAALRLQLPLIAAERAQLATSIGAARIELGKTIIRAPFDGIVVNKDAEKGEVLAPTGAGNARGSVVTIVDPTSFELQVELAEKRILRVAKGDRATITLNADPDTGHPAHVYKIWPRADRSKGTIELRVKFDTPPKVLRPDMAARVEFHGPEEAGPTEAAVRKAYVRVPAGTVRARGEQSFVWLIVEGVLRRRLIELGGTDGDFVIVASGLEGQELLVLDPTPELAEGMAVRVEGQS